MRSRLTFGSLMGAAACVGGAAASSASAPTVDLADTIPDGAAIQLHGAGVSRYPLGGDYPQHDGVRPRTSGFPVARFLR